MPRNKVQQKIGLKGLYGLYQSSCTFSISIPYIIMWTFILNKRRWSKLSEEHQVGTLVDNWVFASWSRAPGLTKILCLFQDFTWFRSVKPWKSREIMWFWAFSNSRNHVIWISVKFANTSRDILKNAMIFCVILVCAYSTFTFKRTEWVMTMFIPVNCWLWIRFCAQLEDTSILSSLLYVNFIIYQSWGNNWGVIQKSQFNSNSVSVN